MITKYRWTANTPRAHITNQRAMEIFRDLGIEDQVLADATPHALVGDTVFCTSIAGEEIGRIRTWGTHPAREADYQLASPCLICDIPQTYLEPIRGARADRRRERRGDAPADRRAEGQHRAGRGEASRPRGGDGAGIAGEAWRAAAAKVGHDLRIPLETVIIGPGRKVTDIYYDWARGREVEEDGALLVRPDKFIGWRSATLPDDPEQALRTALSALLGQ
jgi:FAD binding domain-containing protein/aromatic ring hydroxylase-like protein